MSRLAGLVAVVVASALAASAQAHVPGEGDRVEFGTSRPMALPAQQAAEPPMTATPRANCGPGSRPEPDMQGRVPRSEVDSGRATRGYWCNMTLLGQTGSTGGFRVHRYIDRAGRECAYYDTALLFPTNALSLAGEPTGVAVLDMSDPRNPRRTDMLVTPAMQSPHESVNISVRRGILAAVLGNPTQYPGGVDVYDISKDCRHPEPMAAAFPAAPFGHESGMAPDGMTFYPTSLGTDDTTAVDISNPRLPRQIWNGKFNTHGMSVSDDGKRGYFATGDGLVIADLSEVQARKLNPQVREISRLTWSNMTIPQVAIPVTIKGRPYVVEIDEFSKAADGSGSAADHGPRVGAARIIDIADETRPRVVSNIRLDVHQPENRAAIANDYGARSRVQGYAGHYCNVPRRAEPGILACSMILSGLRVFDIRDPENPREIAYFIAPPSNVSAAGGPIIDERANWAMSQPAFALERNEIWYSDGTSGFYALKLDPRAASRQPGGSGGGPGSGAGCTPNRGFESVGVGDRPRGVRLRRERRRGLPVQVDVFRVSAGRRVVGKQRVARFGDREGSFTWRTRLGRGIYFARYRMFDGESVYATRRIAFERRRSGRVRKLRAFQKNGTCRTVRRFQLNRPAFGGKTRKRLRISYRLTEPADVTVVVKRRGRTVKRFERPGRVADRTYSVKLRPRGLRRGTHRVKLHATSGQDQVALKLAARRL